MTFLYKCLYFLDKCLYLTTLVLFFLDKCLYPITLVLSIALETCFRVGVSIKDLIKSKAKNYQKYLADLRSKYNEINPYIMTRNNNNQGHIKSIKRSHKRTCKYCKGKSHKSKQCFQHSQKNIDNKNWCLLCRSPLHTLTECMRYDHSSSLDLTGCIICKSQGYLAFHVTEHCDSISYIYILYMRNKFPHEQKYQ